MKDPGLKRNEKKTHLKPENQLCIAPLTWGRLDSTGMSGYKLQVEVVRNLLKHRAKQTNANDNVVVGNFGQRAALAA